MTEARRATGDAALAFLIGALVGIGTTLLLQPDDDDEPWLRALRERGYRVRRASRRQVRELRDIIARTFTSRS